MSSINALIKNLKLLKIFITKNLDCVTRIGNSKDKNIKNLHEVWRFSFSKPFLGFWNWQSSIKQAIIEFKTVKHSSKNVFDYFLCIGFSICQNYQKDPLSKIFHTVQSHIVSQIRLATISLSKPGSTAVCLLRVFPWNVLPTYRTGNLIGGKCQKYFK